MWAARQKRPFLAYYSVDNRWLAGVCGGLGEYFNIDPTLIRVIFVLATLLLSFVVGALSSMPSCGYSYLRPMLANPPLKSFLKTINLSLHPLN
ncbi:MAG: PspC domain-containing protein [Chloroflexi bacterium]|nr:PspC domain-containing protein [Chloroflexota bacterium]